jgi:gas vesicle structural protein
VSTRLSGDVALVDLLDRLLDRGVVLSGDIMLSVADVDLVHLSLQVLLSSVERVEQLSAEAEAGDVARREPLA